MTEIDDTPIEPVMCMSDRCYNEALYCSSACALEDENKYNHHHIEPEAIEILDRPASEDN